MRGRLPGQGSPCKGDRAAAMGETILLVRRRSRSANKMVGPRRP